MADINLKTETPDTSLPSDGFLFGADSQSAASPSVYTTQAVATRLLGSTALSGATVTASAPLLDLSQTWNNAGVTFTGLKFNATDTASASGSLLLDLQVGGTSRFRFRKDGLSFFTNDMYLQNSAQTVNYAILNPSGFTQASLQFIAWGNTATNITGADTYLARRAAANLRLGAADAAAPVAQTLSVQSVSSGTTNTAGANLTITGSQGTGTGAGGSIVFQVAPAGSSGTAQNALSTALTINSARQLVGSAGSASTPSFASPDNANTGIYFPFTDQIWFTIGSVPTARILGGVQITSGSYFGFSDQSNNFTGSLDVRLFRDAPNTLALRNGVNAQTFRVYNTFDGTNNEWFETLWSGNTVFLRTQKTGSGAERGISLNAGAGALNVNGSFVQLSAGGSITAYIASDGFPCGSDSAAYDLGRSSLRWRNLFLRGYAQFSEMTAPAAPAANNVVVYAEDDGAGKTRLMARFATGAAVQIAIEP